MQHAKLTVYSRIRPSPLFHTRRWLRISVPRGLITISMGCSVCT